jgi:hypothetical protein
LDKWLGDSVPGALGCCAVGAGITVAVKWAGLRPFNIWAAEPTRSALAEGPSRRPRPLPPPAPGREALPDG